MKKKLVIGIFLMLVISTLSMMPTMTANGVNGSYPLYADQDVLVGEVQVWNDDDNLYVKYVIDVEDWFIIKTHLDIVTDPDDFEMTKNENPIPGHFEYKAEHDYVTEYELDPIPLGDWELGDTIYIAAHAALIKKVSDGGCGYSVDSYDQGTRKSGYSIAADRSDPEDATGPIDNDFFSLGFDGEAAPGGWIIVEFEDYVGTSLTVVEQSPGTGYNYPLEQAEVYVSADSIDWTYLGMAHNQIAGGSQTGQSHLNTFDLEDCVKFVKIVDQTDPTPHGNTADAFDLDAVCGGPCYQDETAWGATVLGEIQFDGPNWATYFAYDIECPTYRLDITSVNGNTNYAHWFEITKCQGGLSGEGYSYYQGWVETVTVISLIGTEISFTSTYPNGYTWYPKFTLNGDGSLTFIDGHGTDNVYAATGTWTVTWS